MNPNILPTPTINTLHINGFQYNSAGLFRCTSIKLHIRNEIMQSSWSTVAISKMTPIPYAL